jgi:hypothetical protein
MSFGGDGDYDDESLMSSSCHKESSNLFLEEKNEDDDGVVGV